MQLKSISLLFLFLFSFSTYLFSQTTAKNVKSLFLDSLNALIDSSESLHSTGVEIYLDGQFEESIALYQKAKDIRLSILKNSQFDKLDSSQQEIVLEGIIKSTHNIASAYYKMGKLEDAKIITLECIQIQTHFKKDRDFIVYKRMGRSYQLLADIVVETGELGDALNHYNSSLNFFFLGNYSSGQALTYLNLSYLYLLWREPDSLLKYSNKAKFHYQNFNNSLKVADCFMNSGLAYMIKKNHVKALHHFDQASHIYSQHQPESLESLSRNIHNKALTLGKLDQYQEAHFLLDSIIAKNINYKIFNLLAGNHSGKADLYYAEKKYREAKTHYQKSIQLHILAPQDKSSAIAIRNFLEKDAIFLVTDKPGLLDAMVGKAKALAGLEQYEQAQSVFDTTLQLLHKFRRDFRDNASKIQMAAIAKDLFEYAIELCIHPEVQDYDLAFQYAEMSRAFTLLEDVKHNQALKSLKDQGTILQKEYDLRLARNNLERQYQNASDPSVKNGILKALQDNKSDLDALSKILETNPEYQATMSDWAMPSTRQIKRKLLFRGQALVEYFVGEEHTYVFVLPKRGKLKVEKVAIGRDSLANLVDAFWDGLYFSAEEVELSKVLIAKYPNMAKDALLNQYVKSATGLYQLLFTPVKNLTSADKFIIIPDEALNNLAFDALLEHEPEFGNYSLFPYLGRAHTISYTHSVNLLKAMQGHVESDAILAFAPSFTGDVLKTKAPFGRLLNNKREVNDICSTNPGNCNKFLGHLATKDTFLKIVNGIPYKIIHLSTHGQADDRNPRNSYISFVQPHTELDTSQLLYASELYTLLLDVEMVVLSACETNKGLIRRGEGIMSFTRGLSAAGAKSVLSTLWSVDDRATRELMVAFYQNLSKDLPKDEALAKAKASLRNNGDFMHPYYWAGFVPIGNMQPGIEGSDNGVLWALGIVLIILVSSLLSKSALSAQESKRVLASWPIVKKLF